MPNSRYFRVENPQILQLLTNWMEDCGLIAVQRKAFLDRWGSPQILVNGRWIAALFDPRQMDPPRELGKGWRKVRRQGFDKYVEPTSVANREMLGQLRLPEPIEIDKVLWKMIVDANPENGRRFYGDGEVKPRMRWTADVDGQLYTFTIIYQHCDVTRTESDWVIAIPDPLLRFDTLDGLVELKTWEYYKYIEEHNALAKETQNATS